MFRMYPKKQDHGTRGQKHEHGNSKYWNKGYFDKSFKSQIAYEKEKHARIEKVELNRLSINCTDEDIEEYDRKSQFIPKAKFFWFC